MQRVTYPLSLHLFPYFDAHRKSSPRKKYTRHLAPTLAKNVVTQEYVTTCTHMHVSVRSDTHMSKCTITITITKVGPRNIIFRLNRTTVADNTKVESQVWKYLIIWKIESYSYDWLNSGNHLFVFYWFFKKISNHPSGNCMQLIDPFSGTCMYMCAMLIIINRTTRFPGIASQRNYADLTINILPSTNLIKLMKSRKSVK